MKTKLIIFMKKKITIFMAVILAVAACYGVSIVKCDATESSSETVNVTFKLTSIPPYTPSKDNIYIAANATNWTPNDPGYKINANKDGTYSATIKMKKGWNVQYKFTRGNWESVEKDTNGGEIDSRLSTVDKDTTIECKVENWADLGPKYVKLPTITGTVNVIENFDMPQLGKKRTLRIYLPKDYDTSVDNHYPVIYMHDGQNLFDSSTANAGGWEVDDTLEKLSADKKTNGAIVVGIDNSNQDRTAEYTPWKFEDMGGGDGDKYVNFIVETLKPYIDTHYRTLKDRENTGIAGSSFGGLISFYGGLKHQDVFGMIGAFSTSFWFNTDEVMKFVQANPKKYNMKLYLDAGNKEELEGTMMADDAKKMYTTLKTTGFTDADLKLVIDPEGIHSEPSWERRFPDAFLWLTSK